ncbi:hypothetical protein [Dactylosporangium sp. NPDC000521]|uniref:hypothetical protein n=1 Tax=Dactylosporangium sp. NPDC000521 TaxID=3363975 RepID=UPI0036867439
MTLHYRRPKFWLLALYFLAGCGVIWASRTGTELTVLVFINLGSTALLILGGLAIVFSLWQLREAFRPDPVVIGEAGLQLKVAGINRLVPWGAIDAVFLEPYVNPGSDTRTHRLVLTPAPGVDLGAKTDYSNQTDGRPSIVLLALDETLHTANEVAQALAAYAGQRFVPAPLSMEK